MTIAAGVIIAWPSTAASIPSGWDRVTDLDDQYLQAIPNSSTEPGTTGGSATHAHTVFSHSHNIDHSHSSTSASVGGTDRGSGGQTVSGVHTHSVTHEAVSTVGSSSSASPATDSASNELNRLAVIWIESDGTPDNIPSGALTFWHSAETPPGWTVYTDAQGRYLRGADAAGDGGGTAAGNANHSHLADHLHTTTHSHASRTSGGPSATQGMEATPDEISAATSTHTHSASLNTFASGNTGSDDAVADATTSDPSWFKTDVIEADSATPLLNNTIAVWLGLLENIPDGWFLCDGTNGTPNLLNSRLLRGADNGAAIGDTGGSNAHSHTGASHSHTGPTSHTHTGSWGSQSATALIRNVAGAAGHALTHSTSHNATSGSGSLANTGNASPGTDSIDNMPPFTEVAFIMWLGNSEVTGSGGLVFGGDATAKFSFGSSGQVDSDIVIEWDFDNDGDFDESEEDITEYVMQMSTRSGRDWPSLLAGKATPGILRATLNNEDNRFSYFNTNSPLTQGDFTLKTGRKIRVRASNASNPDPALLARDRFERISFGAGTETGQSYTQPSSAFSTISFDGDRSAFTGSSNSDHIAVIDVGTADYYAQIRARHPGRAATNVDANRLGLVYRYQDVNNYSRAIVDVDAGAIRIEDIVGGSPSSINTYSTEIYDNMIIGVLLDESTVKVYLDGILIMTETAIQTDETEVGLYGFRGLGTGGTANGVIPTLDDFYVWDGLPDHEAEGVIFTGDIESVMPSVQAGPFKTAQLEARGVLIRPSRQEIYPPKTISGRKTGFLIGNAMSMCNLLHPPCPVLDEGTITTGPFGFPKSNALDIMRQFEETEFGFMYETPGGHITFEDRDARTGTTPVATFSDSPVGGYGYSQLALHDWKREIVNRVESGITSLANFTVSRTTRADTVFNSGSPFTVTLPATINDGDLLIIACVAETGVSAQREDFETLSGWRELTGKPTAGQTQQAWDDSRIYVKVADGTEGGETLTIATTTEAVQTGSGAAHIIRVQNWYGELSGVEFIQKQFASNPPNLTVPWGLEPTLFFAFRWGMEGSGVTVDSVEPPIGFTNGASTTATGADSVNTVQSAWGTHVEEEINPTQFSSTFSGFGARDAGLLAVRGIRRDDIIVLNDYDSQLEHREIRTYRNSARLFKDSTDANAYNALVISRYADDRPIMSMSFFASKSAPYRTQALSRRISDRITVYATDNAGMGIQGDFFIEAIEHRWTNGTKLWETTWDLSPAP